MATTTGVIEQMHESGKRFKLDDGQWYSAFAVSQMPKEPVGVGDTVGFNYSTVEKDGKTYHNIKGNVSKRAGAPRAEAASAPAASASRGSSSGSGYSRGAFPVPALDGSRSIIRQNSLTQANAVLATVGGGWSSIEVAAEKVIEIARLFEAYSAGDLDAAEAEKATEEMRKSMLKTDSHR